MRPPLSPASSGSPPPSGGPSFPTMNTVNTTIVRIVSNSTNNSVNLGTNNTLRGFTIGDSGVVALSGSSFGTLTLAASGSEDVKIDTDVQALNLVTGTVNGKLVGVGSTGGGNNVVLSSIDGTFDLGGGSLAGSAGNAFVVGGGT